MVSPSMSQREWDDEVVLEAFNGEDSSRILRTTPALAGKSDSFIWHFSKDGRYTVKLAYHLAMHVISDERKLFETPWKKVWSIKIAPKAKVLYWRLCRGRLAVWAKLQRWYRGMGGFCPFCSQMTENGNYLKTARWLAIYAG